MSKKSLTSLQEKRDFQYFSNGIMFKLSYLTVSNPLGIGWIQLFALWASIAFVFLSSIYQWFQVHYLSGLLTMKWTSYKIRGKILLCKWPTHRDIQSSHIPSDRQTNTRLEFSNRTETFSIQIKSIFAWNFIFIDLMR